MRSMGTASKTAFVAWLGLVALASCELRPVPSTKADSLLFQVEHELDRFRTKTDRNVACLALIQIRKQASSKSERADLDRRIRKVVSKAQAGHMPPRCIDLLSALSPPDPAPFRRLLENAIKRAAPRAFAAAARALARREKQPGLLVAAAVLTHMTGDAAGSTQKLSCSELESFFDGLESRRPRPLFALLDRVGWNQAAPVRQAAWWLLVTNRCDKGLWSARAAGIGPRLQARALAWVLPPNPGSTKALLEAADLATQFLAVSALGRRAAWPKSLERLSARMSAMHCPQDPGRKALLVRLLEALGRHPGGAARAQALRITAVLQDCPRPWKDAAAEWGSLLVDATKENAR